jgi:hypothetical protein
MVLLPALNSMIDITTTRTMMSQTHPPNVIYGLLFWLALCSAIIAGYGMAASGYRRWVHTIGFTMVLTAAIYITLDLEYPRFGQVQVRAFDQVLREVRANMNTDTSRDRR